MNEFQCDLVSISSRGGAIIQIYKHKNSECKTLKLEVTIPDYYQTEKGMEIIKDYMFEKIQKLRSK